MTTDWPDALRRLADDIRKNDNMRFTAQLIDNFAHDWEAERAQAAADRAALAQAQEAITEDREKWSFDTALYVGALLLAKVYPDDVFTGVSGDDGPTYVVALRDALRTYAQRNTLAQAREVMARIESEARNQITAPDTNAAQMVVSEAVAETCRRIAAALEGGAR